MSNGKLKFKVKPGKSKPRSREEIDQEYSLLCVSIGAKEFRVRSIKEELEQLYLRALDLKHEYKSLENLKPKAKEEPTPQFSNAQTEQAHAV